jgi:flagellar hook-associated protein 2
VSQTGGDGGLAQLEYAGTDTATMKQTRPAQNAHVIVSGTDAYSQTNAIEGVILGVTLNLKAAHTVPGETASVTVTADNAAVKKNVEAFVTAFNKLQDAFVSLRAFNSETKTTGPLFGDALLRSVEDQMRTALSNPVSGISGDYNSLASIGLVRKLDGKLELNATKFDAALNLDAVSKVFASDNGIAKRLDKYLESQLATGASFDFRNTSIQNGLKAVQKDKENLQVRLATVQARYLKQFTALDSLLTNMQQTSSYLTQQLANLPG